MRCNLHTLTKNREGERVREGGGRGRLTKNKAKRLFHAYIEWKAEKPPLVGAGIVEMATLKCLAQS